MIPNPLTSSTFSRNSPVLADLHAKRVSQTGATRFATCFWSTLARGVRWISTFTYASAIALLAAVASQLLGGSAARSWFLLVWAILLLFVVIGLFGHPMRWPAWGLFVGFWGVVGALFLIVLQALALADVLREPAYGTWTAWPLAVVGIWILVASGLGFGNETYPRPVDGLGILTAIGLLAISVATWAAPHDALWSVGLVAVAAYCLWTGGVGAVLWRSKARNIGDVASP